MRSVAARLVHVVRPANCSLIALRVGCTSRALERITHNSRLVIVAYYLGIELPTLGNKSY